MYPGAENPMSGRRPACAIRPNPFELIPQPAPEYVHLPVAERA